MICGWAMAPESLETGLGTRVDSLDLDKDCSSALPPLVPHISIIGLTFTPSVLTLCATMQLTFLAALTSVASAQLVNQVTGSQQVVFDSVLDHSSTAAKYRECQTHHQ